MNLIETDSHGNIKSAHNVPLTNIAEWEVNSAAVYEVDEAVALLVFADMQKYVYNGIDLLERIIATADPNSAVVDAIVTVTATLPEGATDAEVTFQVEGEGAVVEAVANLQASHAYAFALAGTYRIAVSSASHGNRTVEVVVQ